MMHTPLGDIFTLDLTDRDTCRRIIALDKHRLAEGLVVESLFDQHLAALPKDQPDSPVLIDADTAIAANPGGPSYAFVWDRGSTSGLGRYLLSLGRNYSVWLVRYDQSDRDFRAARIEGRVSASDWMPLHEVAKSLSGRQATEDG